MISTYIKKLNELKNKPSFLIKLQKFDSTPIYLRVVTTRDLDNKSLVRKLSTWRRKNELWFPRIFKVTDKRTRNWLQNFVIDKPDRILFMIEDDNGKTYGHLGFYRYKPQDNSCELDNVIRGLKTMPGLMTHCIDSLIKWGYSNLKIDTFYLTTFADNKKAVNLYERCNFRKIDRLIPLKRVRDGNEVAWEEIGDGKMAKAQRYYLRMKLIR